MRLAPLALVLAALAVVPAAAQPLADADEWVSLEGPFDLCTLHDTDEEFEGLNRIRQSAEAKGLVQSATFQVTYTGFSAQAQAAFQYAVDIWATHLEGTVPIKVRATFAPQDPGVLGRAGAGRVWGPGNAAIPNTWYGAPLADQIRGNDLCTEFPGSCTGTVGDADIVASFASNRNDWYFGTDGNPGSGRFDFVTVVLHELGHGLGFFGSMARDDGSAPTECNGTAGTFCHSFLGFTAPPNQFPVIYDRFVEDANGVSILNTSVYPNPSATNGPLGMLVQSGNLFWDSPTVLAVNQNQRPELHAPTTWNGGSSYAHWNEAQFPGGTVNALMTPGILQGEAYDNPGPATCALMQDIGWTLGPGCAALVVADEPGPLAVSGVEIEAAGPNPFRQSTALRVRVGEPQALRATLLDALGREVAVLHDGTAAPGVLTLRVAGDLAPGPYTVLVMAETGRATHALIRVR